MSKNYVPRCLNLMSQRNDAGLQSAMLSTLEVPLPVSTGGGVLCAVRTAFPEQLRDWRYMMCRAVRRICCSMMLRVRSRARTGRSRSEIGGVLRTKTSAKADKTIGARAHLHLLALAHCRLRTTRSRVGHGVSAGADVLAGRCRCFQTAGVPISASQHIEFQ